MSLSKIRLVRTKAGGPTTVAVGNKTVKLPSKKNSSIEVEPHEAQTILESSFMGAKKMESASGYFAVAESAGESGADEKRKAAKE